MNGRALVVTILCMLLLFVILLIVTVRARRKIGDLEDSISAINKSKQALQASVNNLLTAHTNYKTKEETHSARLEGLQSQLQQNNTDDDTIRARVLDAEKGIVQNNQDVNQNDTDDQDVRARLAAAEAAMAQNNDEALRNATEDILREARLAQVETELIDNAFNDEVHESRLDSAEALLDENIANDALQTNDLDTLESRIATLGQDVQDQELVDEAHDTHLSSVYRDIDTVYDDMIDIQNAVQANESNIDDIQPPSFTSASSVDVLKSGDTGVFYQVTLSSNSLVTEVGLESERADLLVQSTADPNIWDVSSTVDGFTLGEDFSMRLTATNEHDMKSEAFNVEISIKDIPTFSPNTADVTYGEGDATGFTFISTAAEDTTTTGLNYSLGNFTGDVNESFYDFTVSGTQLVFTVVKDLSIRGDHSFEVLAENEFGGQDTLLVNVTVT